MSCVTGKDADRNRKTLLLYRCDHCGFRDLLAGIEAGWFQGKNLTERVFLDTIATRSGRASLFAPTKYGRTVDAAGKERRQPFTRLPLLSVLLWAGEPKEVMLCLMTRQVRCSS